MKRCWFWHLIVSATSICVQECITLTLIIAALKPSFVFHPSLMILYLIGFLTFKEYENWFSLLNRKLANLIHIPVEPSGCNKP